MLALAALLRVFAPPRPHVVPFSPAVLPPSSFIPGEIATDLWRRKDLRADARTPALWCTHEIVQMWGLQGSARRTLIVCTAAFHRSVSTIGRKNGAMSSNVIIFRHNGPLLL
jgi:hypothetical protein